MAVLSDATERVLVEDVLLGLRGYGNALHVLRKAISSVPTPVPPEDIANAVIHELRGRSRFAGEPQSIFYALSFALGGPEPAPEWKDLDDDENYPTAEEYFRRVVDAKGYVFLNVMADPTSHPFPRCCWRALPNHGPSLKTGGPQGAKYSSVGLTNILKKQCQTSGYRFRCLKQPVQRVKVVQETVVGVGTKDNKLCLTVLKNAKVIV